MQSDRIFRSGARKCTPNVKAVVSFSQLGDVERHDVNDLQTTVNALLGEMMARTDRGKVIDYVPELRRVDPKKFGIATAPVARFLSATGSGVSAETFEALLCGWRRNG